ncbi:hypothetical protein GNZ42_19975 [Salmonella enterica]|nr:hypothetical protein [Salmonella enterica]
MDNPEPVLSARTMTWQEPVQSTAPLFIERCPAGFPSPAADYTEELQIFGVVMAFIHKTRGMD